MGNATASKDALQMFTISRVFFPLFWEGNIPLHMTQHGRLQEIRIEDNKAQIQ
jgi:hypothetical protein